MSTSLSVSVFVCPLKYLRNHMGNLYQSLCMLPMVLARFSSGSVTKSQGKRQFCNRSEVKMQIHLNTTLNQLLPTTLVAQVKQSVTCHDVCLRVFEQ